MDWLQTLDARLFCFINLGLSNSWCDAVMPFLSGNSFFFPLAFLAGLALVWKGGPRGRVFVLTLVIAVGLTDGLVCNTLKHALGRIRPCWAIPEAHCLVGKSGSGSMPSSHAGNWFAGVMVAAIYYRRSWKFMLPAAVLVGFSRVYNGVHYPSDILVGAVLGAGTAAAAVLTLDALWEWAGRRWCSCWWKRMPSLLDPTVRPAQPDATPPPAVQAPEPAGPGAARR